VARHVAQSTCAVIPPAAPVEGQVFSVVGAVWSRTLPQIPVERLGYRINLGWAADALRLRGAGLLVNVVDQPDLCDFTTPSILDRSPVLIAVGTGAAGSTTGRSISTP